MLGCWRRMVGAVRRHPRAALGALLLLAVVLGWGGYQGVRHLRAWRHYRAARGALERRDLAQAQAHLEACLATWPDDAAVRLLAAQAARRAGSVDAAEQHLEACERLGGSTEATALERALLHAQKGGLADVEDTLRSHLEGGHPDSVLILEVVTSVLMREDRLTEAQGYLDRWLEQSPDDFEALIRRGWVGQSSLDHRAAVRDYERALALRPGEDRVRLALAELLVGTGQAAEAVEHFERLHEKDPRNPAVLYGLARCRRQQGRGEEARRLLDLLLAQRPGDLQGLAERGRLALESRRAAEAEEDLRQAAALDPKDHQLLYSLHRCLKQLGKHDEAREYLARSQRIEAELARVSQLSERIRREAPHDASLRCEVGTILLRNGFSRDGLRWLGTALQEDPRHGPTHRALAEYYEGAGKPHLAARHRRILEQIAAQPPAGPRARPSPRDR